MRTFLVCRRALAAAAFLLWAFLPTSAPAAPAPPGPEKDAPAVNPVEKVRQGLDRVVSLKIDKQALSTAVELLREKTRLNIVLDTQAIQQLGFTPEQPPSPVQVDLQGVKAKVALRAVLDPYGLTYAVIGDAVVVTTEDMAAIRQMRQRVSVHFDKVEFAVALKQLARDTGVNLVLDSRAAEGVAVGPDISGLIHSTTQGDSLHYLELPAAKLSLVLEDAPLETTVRLLSEMAGLKPVRVGNTLFVTRKEIANEMRAEGGVEERQTGFRFADSDGPRNARMWIVGSGRVVSPPTSVTTDVTEPVKVKAVEANPPDADPKAANPAADK